MATKKKNENYPEVLSCERKISPSDGMLSACDWELRHSDLPVPVKLTLKEKTVRSTISNFKDPASNAADAEEILKPNIQRIDSCMLPDDADTLKLDFTLKLFSGVETTCSNNMQAFDAKYHDWVRSCIENDNVMHDLALRYAKNLANGRFFWRNRLGAEELEIVVKVPATGEEFTFNGYDYSVKQFFDEENSEDLKKLAKLMEDTLSGSPDGEEKSLVLFVTGYAKVGNGQEVFPSQEMVIDNDGDRKKEGRKSRYLYAVNGQAAMHSQKIGNAVRTIDTWYDADKDDALPIAIETYGTVTTRSIAHRKSRNDFYSLFKRALVEQKPLSQEEKDYVIAMLIRGGVFGAKESDNK